MVAGPLSVSGEARRRLVGFCTATVAPAAITQSMYGNTNSELARIVCIQNFCVERASRRQGIGQRLMRRLLHRIQSGATSDGSPARQQFETVTIVSPPKRMLFFMKCGFSIHGPSYIARGIEPWVEMRYTIDSPSEIQRADTSVSTATMATEESEETISPPSAQGNMYQVSEYGGERGTSGSSSAELSPSAPWGMGTFSMSPIEATTLPNDQVLAALLAKNNLSEGAARDLGLPVQSSDGQPSARPRSQNPGKLLSSVFGQAVAAKTAAEDSLAALKARLVSRTDGHNLCRLFCPNEKCSCVIVGRQSAEWVYREMGPLSEEDAVSIDSELILLDHASTNMFAFESAIQNRLPGAEGKTIGPVRAFWVLRGPMQFDNVSFSKNTTWKVPEPSSLSRAPSRSFSGASESNSPTSRRPEHRPHSGFGSRRNSIQPFQPKSPETPAPSQSAYPPSSSSLGLTPGEERVVKYILCPDCGCGPLGFMILPSDTASDQAAQKGYSEIPCYFAAYRARYEL